MERRNKLSREEIAATLIGGVGAIAVGLGIYALNTEASELLHPLLGNRMFVFWLIGGGAACMIYEMKTMLPIWKARKESR